MAGHKKPKGKKTRNDGRMVPQLGYYLIVTDTEKTERAYFEGIRDSLPEEIRRRRQLVISVSDTKTKDLVLKCKELHEYDPQYRIPWIVFDRDEVDDFDDIISNAQKEHINVGWSNPCLEIWLYAYFGKMPLISTSWQCCDSFGKIYKSKTGQTYSKSDKDLYKRLIRFGDEKRAIEIAEQKYKEHETDGQKEKKPSEKYPCTTVHELVKEIKAKINDTKPKSDSN